MKMPFFYGFALILLLSGCKKTIESVINKSLSTSNTTSGQFIKYTIPKGEQYCDRSTYKPISITDMKFVVRFDSTAIYQTALPENQYDINKLYGFSDNNADHHQFSARFGWRWSDKALRLFAYIYNNGVMSSKELGTVEIGQDVQAEIKVDGANYIFILNGTSTSMPRASTSPTGSGYQLYPYFGGDEVAPHTITILINDETVN